MLVNSTMSPKPQCLVGLGLPWRGGAWRGVDRTSDGQVELTAFKSTAHLSHLRTVTAAAPQNCHRTAPHRTSLCRTTWHCPINSSSKG